MNRFAPIAVLLLAAPPVLAGPRDELLRVAPADAALVVVVQNAREHAKALAGSPFVEALPQTAVGKKLLQMVDFQQVRDVTSALLPALGTTPQALLDGVLGDAVAFAYSPAPAGKPQDERAVILIRPGKPDALAKIVERINELQTQSGELKAVARREHAGAEYFERQKPEGGAPEFYCFRNGVFAFSSNEADVKDVLDRDRSAPKDAPPALVVRLRKLGVADALAVVLVNPRPLDAEVKAKIAAAKPEEHRLYARFGQLWDALEFAAVSLSVGSDAELALSLRFHPDKVPADVKTWFVGPREPIAAAQLIPDNALAGFAGHAKASELLDLAASLAPEPAGKPGVKEWVAKTLGVVVVPQKLSLVLDSLGPNWAAWVVPPEKDGFLPVVVGAVEVSGEGEKRATAEKTLLQTVEFGFQMARVAYNTRHADQIDLEETRDAATGVVVKSLVNDKGFPPGFRPSFAMVKGYLVVATSPDAIKAFQGPPAATAAEKGTALLARFSGTHTRAYLAAHGHSLARFLAELGAGDEATLRAYASAAGEVLELIDTVDLTRRDLENGLKLSLRVKPTKPLKK
ncbi:Uncharacterized protein OS=Singulisphaera acidiphila (strain ATCC BAA-1392 / DSM 18658 / VKM B-2454 / MOB10) GN=Sinac_5524 PE=4 SV=1 [Gemmataceae bacterium]|nr:Uncharacterized protein OS=Singulisphaera acidiphila (strain ATCC BAA-1392 / DSM 18658 / VKM B-2454 / MOB10) GN=Sinac_5524 PE=4 SV=1 [Gemmataceae bacterium]VTT99298.1 Uncharacterized protein OS=Singulisphaera acidiphila (strain ATCC BAA-1392 / DSM 18658 / VKM B-2454 / MOB10) GN=Sinac_5524 PE=4 SV=1 [Gemmataceae bacterium]